MKSNDELKMQCFILKKKKSDQEVSTFADEIVALIVKDNSKT